MDPEFSTLLDATLAHLKELRDRGIGFVNVDPELLKALGQPPLSRKTPIAPPAASPSPAASLREEPAVRYSLGKEPPAATPVAQSAPALSPPLPTTLARAVVSDRASALAEIRSRAVTCQICPHLVRSRTQVVFGVGDPNAELMFVGEAPGADEDRIGEPFVGRAGQLLTRIIQAMGYARETVYIANILKCRPDLPDGLRGNRPPRPEEMDACKPYLVSQIEIIQPKVIVALGLTAVQGLIGMKGTMGSVRGRWQSFRGVPVMPTFHPSYLVRSEDDSDRGHAQKRKTWEDMLLVLERLQRPITDKMRRYFLKASPSDSADPSLAGE